jgi:hypothetical protein
MKNKENTHMQDAYDREGERNYLQNFGRGNFLENIQLKILKIVARQHECIIIVKKQVNIGGRWNRSRNMSNDDGWYWQCWNFRLYYHARNLDG